MMVALTLLLCLGAGSADAADPGAPGGPAEELYDRSGWRAPETLYGTVNSGGSVAGYFTPDEYKHAIVTTAEGYRLWENYYNETYAEAVLLTELSPSTTGRIVSLGAYYNANERTQHVITCHEDGGIRDTHWDGIPLETVLLYRFPAGSIVSCDGYYSFSDHLEHVLVNTRSLSSGPDQIYQLYWGPGVSLMVRTMVSSAPYFEYTDIAGFQSANYLDAWEHTIPMRYDGLFWEQFYSCGGCAVYGPHGLGTFSDGDNHALVRSIAASYWLGADLDAYNVTVAVTSYLRGAASYGHVSEWHWGASGSGWTGIYAAQGEYYTPVAVAVFTGERNRKIVLIATTLGRVREHRQEPTSRGYGWLPAHQAVAECDYHNCYSHFIY
jgi:hypothetical protein